MYWINLESSRERRENLQTEFSRAGITKHTRVQAVTPQDLGSFTVHLPQCAQRGMIETEWCCTLSHLKAIWTAM